MVTDRPCGGQARGEVRAVVYNGSLNAHPSIHPLN
jgi:hypothetical protein